MDWPIGEQINHDQEDSVMVARADLHRLIDVLPDDELPTARRVLEALATISLGQVASELPTTAELTALAQAGGTFAWLADEPDLYSLADGEPMS